MTCLVLRLAGPLQAWGTGSRFAYRGTDTHPSKSAVLGLLAAAQGRRRTDPIEDLLSLRFGVRCDQPGSVVRDFQTARALDESYALPLTYRFYLSDACFAAAVEGEDGLIEGLIEALQRPAFPLYLGRRSCPPAQPVLVGVRRGPLKEVLGSTDPKEGIEWGAHRSYRRDQPPQVELEIVRDASAGEPPHDRLADAPVTFDPRHRRYAMRQVVRETVKVANPDSRRERSAAGGGTVTDHSPFSLMEH